MWIVVVIIAVIVIWFIASKLKIKRVEQEIDVLRAKANNGDMQAMFEIGKLYKKLGSTSDENMAIFWFEKAAENGHPDGDAKAHEIRKRQKDLLELRVKDAKEKAKFGKLDTCPYCYSKIYKDAFSSTKPYRTAYCSKNNSEGCGMWNTFWKNPT